MVLVVVMGTEAASVAVALMQLAVVIAVIAVPAIVLKLAILGSIISAVALVLAGSIYKQP